MSVFTSRWKALWWSAGILMTAYCSVPSAEETKQDETDKVEAATQAKQIDSWHLNSPEPGGQPAPE